MEKEIVTSKTFVLFCFIVSLPCNEVSKLVRRIFLTLKLILHIEIRYGSCLKIDWHGIEIKFVDVFSPRGLYAVKVRRHTP